LRRRGRPAMIVQCQQCDTKYRVAKERVPEAGIKAKCKGCGHVMIISPSEAPKEPTEHIPPQDDSLDEPWKCACGTINEAGEDYCIKCKRSKLLFTSIPRETARTEEGLSPTAKAEASSSHRTLWRSLLIVAALAVVLGVGISYALGYAVNRSITTFLTTIFK
jgi:predicted Zn finger-like uncharacterized protein